MSENESPQETEVDEVEHEEDYEPEPKPLPNFLIGLEQYEAVLNEGAVKFAKRYRVPEGKWKIHLVANTRDAPTYHIRGGAIAEIILTWPAAQKDIRQILDRAFRFISKNQVIDVFAIQTVLYAQKMKGEARKWIRKELDDESEILLDLVPRYRLMETITTTYKLEDTKTGKTVSITTETKDHYKRKEIDLWMKLSRLVREVEAPDLSTDEIETPELDNALEKENGDPNL